MLIPRSLLRFLYIPSTVSDGGWQLCQLLEMASLVSLKLTSKLPDIISSSS